MADWMTLDGGFRKQRGPSGDGSRLLINGAVAERLLDAGHGDKRHHAPAIRADDCGDRVDPGMADEPAGAIVARPLVADRIRDALHVGLGLLPSLRVLSAGDRYAYRCACLRPCACA